MVHEGRTRMVIDAKKNTARHVAERRETVHDLPDVRALSREQRAALVAHLDAVDATDNAFDERNRALREQRKAQTSGDSTWLTVALQHLDRTDEAWEQAKVANAQTHAALSPLLHDVEFGRKRVRDALRQALTANETAFTQTPETAPGREETAQEAAPENVETVHNAAAEALAQEKARFSEESLEAARVVQAACAEIDVTAEEAKTKLETLAERLSQIHITRDETQIERIAALQTAARECLNRLTFAREGVEDATKSVSTAVGEPRPYDEMAPMLRGATETLADATMRLAVVTATIEELVPHLSRVDNVLFDEWTYGTHARLMPLGRIAHEQLQTAHLQLARAAETWQELNTHARVIATMEDELPAAQTAPEETLATAAAAAEAAEAKEQETLAQEAREAATAMEAAIRVAHEALRRTGKICVEISHDLAVVRNDPRTASTNKEAAHALRARFDMWERSAIPTGIDALARMEASAAAVRDGGPSPAPLADRIRSATDVFSRVATYLQEKQQELAGLIGRTGVLLQDYRRPLGNKTEGIRRSLVDLVKTQGAPLEALGRERPRWQQLAARNNTLNPKAPSRPSLDARHQPTA